MSTQATFDSVARDYQDLLVPLIFEDYAADLTARVRVPEGGAVLETACGTGVVTRRMREHIPSSARLVATDFNEAMLDVARGAALNGSVEFRPADATDLPFGDAEFDALVCQFGVMFFPDEHRGREEAARVLKPGGRFLFSVWDTLEANPLFGCAHDAVCRLCPDDPPRFLEKPFIDCDLMALARDLQKAGFGDVSIDVLPRTCRSASAADVAAAIVRGSPIRAQLEERGVLEPAAAAIEQDVRSQFGHGPIAAPMQAIVVEAARS